MTQDTVSVGSQCCAPSGVRLPQNVHTQCREARLASSSGCGSMWPLHTKAIGSYPRVVCGTLSASLRIEIGHCNCVTATALLCTAQAPSTQQPPCCVGIAVTVRTMRMLSQRG